MAQTTAFTFLEILLAWMLTTAFAASAISWHRNSPEIYASSRLFYKNPRNVPSELCPRDESQAQLGGRTCLRKCTNDEDCKSKRKKCMCDGACGLSCVKPERECLDPEPPLELGEVHASGKFFGSKATYVCPDGFKVIGMEERICQADGSWSGTPPSCQKNTFCTSPPVIEHARHNGPLDQKTFDLDFSLQYQCLPGYITKGFARTKCFLYNGTAKWFGPDIICEPKSCGEPQDILNGRREGECIHVGCEISYVCQPGFEIVGRAKHSCQSDGSWTPKDLPTCVPVQCPIPENPANGNVEYGSLSFNSLITYKCKYGYMLDGDGTRRCGPNKRWSGGSSIQCKEINCGSPGVLPNGWLEGQRTTLHAVVIFHCEPGMTFEGSEKSVCQSDNTWSHLVMPKCLEINCGPPGNGYLHNGWMENLEHGTQLGASIIFRCFDGMTLVGNTSTVCSVDGKWRYPPPLCLAPCKVPVIPFGNVTMKEEWDGSTTTTTPPPTTAAAAADAKANLTTIPPIVEIILKPGTTIAHGKSIGVKCETNYEASHLTAPPTCHNGTWTHAPKCQPARCKNLPKAPRHGMVIAPKTEHGMRSRFTCRDGYILLGNNVTECQYGSWVGDPPVCNQTFCKFPGVIPNGRVLLVGNMGLYDYRNYVTKVANNRQIMFDCEKGYVLADGPQGKTCIRGEWSPKAETPKCIASQHPNFRWVRSVRSIRRKRKAGAKQAGSAAMRNKQFGGRGGDAGGKRGSRKHQKVEGEDEDDYEEAPSVCSGLDHDPYIQIETIQNGEDNTNQSFSHGSVVRVSCTHGFGVNLPNETIKCVQGRWKPKLPQCSALPCRVPYLIHGTFYEKTKGLVFQDFIKHGMAIDLKCTKGYALRGPAKLVCWYGEWDVADAPECVPAPCKLPSLNYGTYEKGYRSGMHVTHSTEVDYTCDGDFRKVSPGNTACILGDFRPTRPACFHPSNLPFANGSFPSNGFNGNHNGELDGDKKKKMDKETMKNVYNGIKRMCGSAPRERGAVAFVEGRPVDYSMDFSFPDGIDIQYRCINVKPKVKNRWRVTCNDGLWTTNANTSCEPANATDFDIDELLVQINGTCKFKNLDKYVATFFTDRQIGNEPAEFPTGTILVSRCVDIGKFRLKGNVQRRCLSGQWLGVTPKCEGLSQFYDYALGKPPTILFRYENGSIIQSNDGRLLIYEGTTLHMECLWIRKFGTPKWEISNKHREYQEGWAELEGRNRDLEYRLTIDNAQLEDSGTYRCSTPARYTHEVNIEVTKTHCSDLPESAALIYSTNSTALGAVISFECHGGNSVVGNHQITCMPSGNWSGNLPKCENVQCQDISLLPAMAPMANPSRNTSFKKNETAPPKISIASLDVGGKALFTCPQGYVADGASEATCQSSGKWSNPLPICKEVECSNPSSPDNGFVTGKPPYKAGDLAQFECQPNYMMEGQPIIACQDNGKWSRAVGIKCVVSCPYPGTTIGGTISKVKFYYAIGETVEFDCTDEYELHGSRMLHCQKNGKWSNTVPTCVSKHGNSYRRVLDTDRKIPQNN